MSNDEERAAFNEYCNRRLDQHAETVPDHFGRNSRAPYQIWCIKYTDINEDVKKGYTCDRDFAKILIKDLGWESDPERDTFSYNNEAKFKKWKEYSILHLPPHCRNYLGLMNIMDTWWVNYKNKDKSSFLDKEGKNPLSTTQLVCESSRINHLNGLY